MLRLKLPFYLHREPLERKYKGSIIIFIISWIITIIVPIIIVMASGSFWIKESGWREQPTVTFKHKALLLLETDTAGQEMAWSTLQRYNELVGNALIVPAFEVSPVDLNRDGKTDRFDFKITAQIPAGRLVRSVKTLLFFDYNLKQNIPVSCETAAFISHASPLPGSNFYTEGYLKFHQALPLDTWRGQTYVYSNNFFNNTALKSISDAKFPTILSNYFRFPIRADFTNDMSDWAPAVSTSGTSTFTVTASVHIPEDWIVYRSTRAELFKFGWVQYLSFFLLVWFFVYNIKGFLVTAGLINSGLIVDAPVQFQKLKKF